MVRDDGTSTRGRCWTTVPDDGSRWRCTTTVYDERARRRGLREPQADPSRHPRASGCPKRPQEAPGGPGGTRDPGSFKRQHEDVWRAREASKGNPRRPEAVPGGLRGHQEHQDLSDSCNECQARPGTQVGIVSCVAKTCLTQPARLACLARLVRNTGASILRALRT